MFWQVAARKIRKTYLTDVQSSPVGWSINFDSQHAAIAVSASVQTDNYMRPPIPCLIMVLQNGYHWIISLSIWHFMGVKTGFHNFVLNTENNFPSYCALIISRTCTCQPPVILRRKRSLASPRSSILIQIPYSALKFVRLCYELPRTTGSSTYWVIGTDSGLVRPTYSQGP